MSLLDAVRKAEHWLGLTRETSADVFDETIYEDAIVAAKEPLPCFPDIYELLMRFEGESGPKAMRIENAALFDKLNIGDRVRLCCRRRYSIVRDYVPPDFEHMRVVGQEAISYEFVSAVRQEK
ncbi:MAG TPA: hypothetical protein HA362_02525 [Nanoarchaeota archaeon]|nr:hypothetical protein [Nanoarchaeota archaeon]